MSKMAAIRKFTQDADLYIIGMDRPVMPVYFQIEEAFQKNAIIIEDFDNAN